MQGKKEFNQRIYYNINLDCLVPEDHLLKRLERLVSFDFVRDITRDYYSHTGKPSIDPVVLVKMLLVGYLFDIRSERKLIEEITLNLAYPWYIGYDLDEEVPNHSVFSKARVRFGKKLFVDIFEKILIRCMELGLVSSEGMLIDSTINAVSFNCRSTKFKENCKNVGYRGNKFQAFQEIYRYCPNFK